MMKKYVKPELFYERFELNQQIAACDFDSNNTFENVGSCGFTGTLFGKTVTVFLEGSEFCAVPYDHYCEHNGSDNGSTGRLNIFNS